jgi:glycosyltransferase involved in cell wall biosynthesis
MIADVPKTDGEAETGQRSRSVELSVIVPAYKAGRRIHDNLTHLVRELDTIGVPYEVIVVSDGNTDHTVREARRHPSPAVKVFHYPMNVGKGFALSFGVAQSSGPLVTFIDADMELDPANIKTFIKQMESSECDAVIGSKRHPQSQVSYPAFRRFQSAVYQIFVHVLFGLDARDTQTGLKLFRREVLEQALPLLAIKRFAFDLELLVVARFLGFRKICEAPIKLDYKFQSTVNLRSAFDVLWDTAAIFYRLRILRYYERRRRELQGADGDEEPMAEAASRT